MNTLGAIVLAVAFSLSCWLTGRLRRYALARRVLDVPNARSSHSIATPRGGGMAIVLTTLAIFLVLLGFGILSQSQVWPLVGGGGFVAAIGFADDHRHVARWLRLLAHFAAATWVLWWIGGLPQLPVVGAVVVSGWTGHLLAAVYLVWVINLTNFMDGIDAIAAVETLTVCLGGVVLYMTVAPAARHWLLPLALAGATTGFLVWNWPPARIFMGDGGSGFIGLMLAALSLQAAWEATTLFWSWVILLGVFIVDATMTLVRRILRGETIYEAHRTHAYQQAAVRWGAHRPVALAVGAINLGWLLPIAVLVARQSLEGLVGLLVAYAPLVIIAAKLDAGVGMRVDV
jgi:Fuc2NAc and GlcNAc transferase